MKHMKKLSAVVVAVGIVIGAIAAPQAANAAAGDPIYTLDKSAGYGPADRLNLFAPLYVVYSDARTAVEAEAVVADLGIAQHLADYKTKALVMGPANGSTYDAEADLANFQALAKTLNAGYTLNNLKVIGIGSGATFVNNVISQNAAFVAGIYTYGGSIDAALAPKVPVPAYVHGVSTAVSNYYVSANSATSKVESSTYTTYTNPAPNASLQRTVVSKLIDAQESVGAGFQNAWKTVFSKNYRLFVEGPEFYAPGFDPTAHTAPWELATYPMYDELGLDVKTVQQNLTGAGTNLWYEFIPRATTTAGAKTVPLVLMLHGNGNDNRTQGEASGWPELAAKQNIILVQPEWQGNGFTALGEAGTMALIDHILQKYPQVDPSRVYLTGLSAGALSSYSYGINNINKIAAIAGSSAPNGNAALITAATAKKESGKYLPMYSILGTKDMYHPIPVTTSGNSFYNTIRAFAVLNDLTVGAQADLAANPIFGTHLDGQAWQDVAGRQAMVGTLSNQQGVMMKLVGLDPYGHWNYKPAVEDIWAFLSQYRRDVTTGKLIIATSAEVQVTTTIPDGGLALKVAANSVNLGRAQLDSGLTNLVAKANLPTITVADLRAANPGWTLTAVSTDFAGVGQTIDGKYLGVTPTVLGTSSGQVATAGTPVAPGTGFKSGTKLAGAAAGAGLGTATIGGELELRAPATTGPGDYVAKVVVTVF